MSKQEIRKIYRTARREDFPESLKLVMDGRTMEYVKVRWTIDGQNRSLRYGTNPHQKAAFYKPVRSRGGIGNVEWIKWGKDGPSATNIEDGSHGLRIVRYFEGPAAAVMKHLNPSGVAVGHNGQNLSSVYASARDADPRAAFGSVVAFNRPVDRSTAKELSKTFVEVVYAPDFEPSALTILNAKKNIRLGKVRTLVDDQTNPDIVALDDGSLIFKDSYSKTIQSENGLKQLPVTTRRLP